MPYSTQVFGTTNKPDTCLWCGRKLRWATVAEHEASEWIDANGQKKPYMKSTGRKVRVHDKLGPYGDGFFCTLGCGWQFGLAAAGLGFRLKPKKED